MIQLYILSTLGDRVILPCCGQDPSAPEDSALHSIPYSGRRQLGFAAPSPTVTKTNVANLSFIADVIALYLMYKFVFILESSRNCKLEHLLFKSLRKQQKISQCGPGKKVPGV